MPARSPPGRSCRGRAAARQGRHPGWGDGPAVQPSAGARLSSSRSSCWSCSSSSSSRPSSPGWTSWRRLGSALGGSRRLGGRLRGRLLHGPLGRRGLAGDRGVGVVRRGRAAGGDLAGRPGLDLVVLARGGGLLRCRATDRLLVRGGAHGGDRSGRGLDGVDRGPDLRADLRGILGDDVHEGLGDLLALGDGGLGDATTTGHRGGAALAEVERGALALGAQIGDDLLAAGCGGVVLVLGVARDDEALVEDAGREVLRLRDEALGIRRRELLELGGAALEVGDALLEVLLQLVRLLLGTLAQVGALGLSAGDLQLLAGGADRVDRDVRGADDGVERRRVDLDVGHTALDLDELSAHVGNGGLGLLLGVLDGLGDLLGECHLSSPSR